MTETLNLTRSFNDAEKEAQLEAERQEFIEQNAPRLGTVENDIAARALRAMRTQAALNSTGENID